MIHIILEIWDSSRHWQQNQINEKVNRKSIKTLPKKQLCSFCCNQFSPAFCLLPWLKKIIWVIGVLRRTVVSDWRSDNLCGSHLQSQVFPHRLSKRQSLTTVLLRTPITQMIFFNQGMLLLGSNHFLISVYCLTLFSNSQIQLTNHHLANAFKANIILLMRNAL